MSCPTMRLDMTVLTGGIARRFHGRVAEWHMAVVMLLCGIVLLSPGETFALAPYAIMREFASELAWGAGLFLVGLARLAVLTINGAWRRGAPYLRALLAGLSALIWSFLLGGYLAMGIPTMAAAMLGGAMMVDMLNVWRGAAAASVEEQAARGGG